MARATSTTNPAAARPASPDAPRHADPRRSGALHPGRLSPRARRHAARKLPRASSAFTLVESMIAVVILALAVTTVAGVLSAARSQGGIVSDAAIAQELARQLMEEITSRPFADPDGPSTLGPEPGETGRPLFDNIDDYHAYADTLAREKDDQYERSVTVEYRTTRNGAPTTTGDFAVVTVTVVGPDARSVVLSQFLTAATTRR